MPLALNPNGLTDKEILRLRLLLSVYQDGIGMLATEDTSALLTDITPKGKHARKKLAPGVLADLPLPPQEEGQRTLPGWRDFERAVALAFDGTALESKAIVDVIIPLDEQTYYGVSCKSRRELSRALKPSGRVNIEVSNSAGKFWDYVLSKGITRQNYREIGNAARVGQALIALVHDWHQEIDLDAGGVIDLSRSSYLVLQYNNRAQYKLYQYPLALPDADELAWSYPNRVRKDGSVQQGRRLVGVDQHGGVVIEWYEYSGGQLKYYPLASDAVWSSEIFTLLPLPPGTKHGILSRAEAYFPDLWKTAFEENF